MENLSSISSEQYTNNYREIAEQMVGMRGQKVLRVEHHASYNSQFKSCVISSKYFLGLLNSVVFQNTDTGLTFDTKGYSELDVNDSGKFLKFAANPLAANLENLNRPVNYYNPNRPGNIPTYEQLKHINALKIIIGNDAVEEWFESTHQQVELEQMKLALEFKRITPTRIW